MSHNQDKDSSECSHLAVRKRTATFFHTLCGQMRLLQGPERIKPFASYNIYYGILFDMADHALYFIMSKLDRRIGTRDNGPIAEASYEIPEIIVAQMIINGIETMTARAVYKWNYSRIRFSS